MLSVHVFLHVFSFHTWT